MVVLGSFVGTSLRYLLTQAVLYFPISTNVSPSISLMLLFQTQPFLLPNMLGCLIMGYLSGISPHLCIFWPRSELKSMHKIFKGATVGFCGSLTTFSSWLNLYMGGSFSKIWFAELSVFVVEFATTWSFFQLGFLLFDHHHQLGLQSHQAPLPSESDGNKTRKDQSKDSRHDDDLESNRQIPSLQDMIAAEDPLNNQSQKNSDMSEEKMINISHDIININLEMNSTLDKQSLYHTVENMEHLCSHHQQQSSFDAAVAEQQHQQQQLPSTETIVHILAIITWIGFAVIWMLVIIDIANGEEQVRNGLRTLALAPFGAGLRFFLSRQPLLIDHWTSWKLHTLLCNLMGVVLAVSVSEYAQRWIWRQPFLDGRDAHIMMMYGLLWS